MHVFPKNRVQFGFVHLPWKLIAGATTALSDRLSLTVFLLQLISRFEEWRLVDTVCISL